MRGQEGSTIFEAMRPSNMANQKPHTMHKQRKRRLNARLRVKAIKEGGQ